MAGDRRAMAGSKVPPPEQEQLPCPRCDSSNTKFCYYNNYNFSQPRHFCKSCRRYWTQGGTLRDIPVGGGTRKTTAKRPRTLPSPPLGLAPGSFTSLLNASAAPSAFLALGGLGLGIAPGMWGFPELGYMGSDGTALMPGWHMEDHPDCFSSPALAISTTGPGHALN